MADLFVVGFGPAMLLAQTSRIGNEDAGIGEWIAFFRALAQDYPGIVPVSAAAWLLVGVQVILGRPSSRAVLVVHK